MPQQKIGQGYLVLRHHSTMVTISWFCNEKYLEARKDIATKCLPRLLGIFAMVYTESNLAKV